MPYVKSQEQVHHARMQPAIPVICRMSVQLSVKYSYSFLARSLSGAK